MSNHGDSICLEQLAFDRSRLAPGARMSGTAYWSSETGPLYRSDDGGLNWGIIENSQFCGKGIIKIHPEKGFVYTANEFGFWRSEDRGRTFTQVLQVPCTGLDVIDSVPAYVFVCSADRIFISRDAGSSFESVEPHGIPDPRLSRLKVCPGVINTMCAASYRGPGPDAWERWFSSDSGRIWKQAAVKTDKNFFPFRMRMPLFSWHAKQPKTAWSSGGDFPMKTTDGGASWQWASTGFCATTVGGRFHFNVADPDVMFIGLHDFSGVLTTDGARSWEYMNVNGGRHGGFVFGAYAGSRKILFCGMAVSRFSNRSLAVSQDAGQNFSDTGLVWSGADTSMGDPTDPDIFFASDLRSTDAGKTWKRMDGCDGVFTCDPATHELFGRKDRKLVVSKNHGASWNVLATMEKEISDVATEISSNRIYVVCLGRLYLLDLKDPASPVMSDLRMHMPDDQSLGPWITSVACDPSSPGTVFAAGSRNIYSTSAAVLRSVDGGTSWEIISRTPENPHFGMDGGREPLCIRVHPATHELFVGTDGYGFWKFGPVKK
jgi:hypothetical protein